MKDANIDEAVFEAERFLKRVSELRKNGASCGPDHAAVRRASLDLTKALAPTLTVLKEAQKQPAACSIEVHIASGYEAVKWISSQYKDGIHHFYARPVPAAPAKFTDDELAEIHQIAYDLGGTESGEYILDGEQLDTVIVKAASLFYKPVPAAVAALAVPKEWRDLAVACSDALASYERFGACCQLDSCDMIHASYLIEQGEKARSLLQSTPQPAVAVPAEWQEVLTELADDLSIELDVRYESRSHYPSELRKYENEMQLVYRARALLQSVEVK